MSKEQQPNVDPHHLEYIAQLAKEQMLAFGNHAPIVIAEGQGQNITIELADLAETHQQRIQQLFLSGMALARLNLINELYHIYFISEAWMSIPNLDVEASVPPLQDTNRIEALVIAMQAVATQESELLVFEIMRDDDDEVIGIEQRQHAKDTDEKLKVFNPLLQSFVLGYHIWKQGQSED